MNNFLAEQSFIVPWLAEEVLTKNMNILLMFFKKLKYKKWKIVMNCIQNMTFLLADVFEKKK